MPGYRQRTFCLPNRAVTEHHDPPTKPSPPRIAFGSSDATRVDYRQVIADPVESDLRQHLPAVSNGDAPAYDGAEKPLRRPPPSAQRHNRKSVTGMLSETGNLLRLRNRHGNCTNRLDSSWSKLTSAALAHGSNEVCWGGLRCSEQPSFRFWSQLSCWRNDPSRNPARLNWWQRGHVRNFTWKSWHLQRRTRHLCD